MNRFFCCFLAFSLFACASKAPRLRIATATPDELAAARDMKEVWYHFEKGDVVPFSQLFYGAGVGGARGVPVEAQRDFFLVFRKDQPVTLSLDGKRRMETGSTILLVTPAPEGKGGQVNWMTFIGRATEAEKELEALFKGPASEP